ncbi:hypothetical protein [Actinomadura alba]|uniref:Uncharacterized protein n=1 Tax=Actinomadura alba TaxID=406431 RepID=A0ABR7LZH1_9ACTN|nr:hypothetical protein [Actinomadura alba]MBC6470243.1 hypothetical protein [Actinomadura alba]
MAACLFSDGLPGGGLAEGVGVGFDDVDDAGLLAGRTGDRAPATPTCIPTKSPPASHLSKRPGNVISPTHQFARPVIADTSLRRTPGFTRADIKPYGT